MMAPMRSSLRLQLAFFCSIAGFASIGNPLRSEAPSPAESHEAAERVFTVNGIVRQPARDGRIIIAHQDIPGYMPAMTMPFNVADTPDVTELKPGDRVRFQLHVTDDASRADHFERLGRAAEPRPSSALPKPGKRLKAGDTVPGFQLADEEGRPLDGAAYLKGHFTVVSFLFTRCPVPEFCPLTARKLRDVQSALQGDPRVRDRSQILVITIDPEFDTPTVLKAYGESVGADPHFWKFATGNPEQVKTLMGEFGLYAERNNGLLDHTLATAVVGSDGRLLEVWRGNGWKADEVADFVRFRAAPMAEKTGE